MEQALVNLEAAVWAAGMTAYADELSPQAPAAPAQTPEEPPAH